MGTTTNAWNERAARGGQRMTPLAGSALPVGAPPVTRTAGLCGSARRALAAKAAGPMLLIALAAGTAACRQDMHDQPRYEPLEASDFFADGRASRPLVEGVVARGTLVADEAFRTGLEHGEKIARFPMPVTADVLDRGRDRFNIYCSPCHDRVGNGGGMVVQRGLRRPPSFHIDRLREAPPGYFFDVITNGFGAMPDYRIQVPVADRWAIIAYVKALQLSQHAALADVPAGDRGLVDQGPQSPEPIDTTVSPAEPPAAPRENQP